MKTKVTRNTWMGRPGTSTEHQLGISGYGLRVVEHQWEDEATATVRVIFGNAYTDPAGFREYLKVEGVEPGQALVLAESLAGDLA